MIRQPSIRYTAILFLCAALFFTPGSQTDLAAETSKPILADVQMGTVSIKRIGRMSFAPNGVLLIADIGSGAVVAIETGDTGPVKKLKSRVNDVDKKIATALGVSTADLSIADMAVNPESGMIYVSAIRKTDNTSAIITFDANGKLTILDLTAIRFVRVPLPVGEGSQIRNISGVEYTDGRVLAAGQSNEEFSSKIFSLPLPLTHGKSGDAFSTETYHVAHGKWETRAPIQSFIPYREGGEDYVVGSFACTPIAKFKVTDIAKDSKIKGTSVVELGSGNRPIDMFTYEKDGKQWLITNTDRFHHEKRPLGPSQYWGVRVDMSYLTASKVNADAARRDVSKQTGPAGIEVVEALFYVRHVAKLNNREMVVLRDNKGAMDLEVKELP
ncbi:MAG: hypothetical protein HOA14_02080 [Planctomycetaceae bacterium]|nr:hypothetical protein [Planctomycetaceae bacterium]MBT4012355.1 hypothetical protein [Planctomycetaceae bacterium]MBT5124826.1 hypothetical protein [Planctomycetaceae bacterium]MBT5599517.1 hypothetical protein [Planctomycetaceae bacterium]MBT6846187.1 hypothetical protein [Planctomycetaceae bacterium]